MSRPRSAVLAALALAIAAGCARESGSRLNIVLLLLDTVRAESLSAYGYERATSPVIRALAEESSSRSGVVGQKPAPLEAIDLPRTSVARSSSPL